MVKFTSKLLSNNVENVFRLYVPDSLIQILLKDHHDIPIAGHLGIEKTYERLRRMFYWPNMLESVKHYVRNCQVCKSSKSLNFTTRPRMDSFDHPVSPGKGFLLIL